MLYSSQTKRGATLTHIHLAHVNEIKYARAVRELALGETSGGIFDKFLGLLGRLDLSVNAVYHDLTGEVTFLVFIGFGYQQGRFNKYGVARQRRSPDARFIDTPLDAREPTASVSSLTQAIH